MDHIDDAVGIEYRQELDGPALRAELLSMLLAFDGYCHRHGLVYSLAAGTLLGAVRHKGFIPWDDDADIGMARPYYQRLLESASDFQEETGYGIEGYFDLRLDAAPFVKVVNRNIFVEANKQSDRVHLWMDIFPFDGLPFEPRDVVRLYRKANFYQLALSMLANHPDQGTRGRRVLKHLFAPFRKSMQIREALSRRLVQIAQSTSYDGASYIGSIAWGRAGARERITKRGFLDTHEIDFEGHKLKAMSCWDDYLTGLYSAWYVYIPPEDSRETHVLRAWRYNTNETQTGE